MVGGNLVVGIIIFLIITIVQFLVITKGAERVAEVSARFSLDAMPGKQMSIDGDMRAGVIDVNEARARRAVIEKESQMFGSMDGAMKFVKGDAIAGLIIIVVNILGGITIGVTQKGPEHRRRAATVRGADRRRWHGLAGAGVADRHHRRDHRHPGVFRRVGGPR